MEQDWIIIYKTPQMYQAELFKHHLDEANIEAVILNQTDSAFAGLTAEDTFEASVQVRKEDEQKAREILKKYNA